MAALAEFDKIDDWTPYSWQSKAVQAQAIEYQDQGALDQVCKTLQMLPPLISNAQIEATREVFRKAAKGEAFILQGGDCAESFQDVQLDIIGCKASLLIEQASIIEPRLGLPVLCVGRIAGQYAKPRSNPFENLADGTIIHAFRGHNVNGVGLEERTPDPTRLLLGYFYSATTLHALNMLQNRTDPSRLSPIVNSHEALHLPYEYSQTRGRYNTSAAFVWLGERTRQLDGAHVEYLRGLRNPIGVKLGPTADPSDVVALLDKFCPNKKRDAGRVTLITRLGARNVESALPKLIHAVQASGHEPVWMCDPCHGNTVMLNGIKTRCVMVMLEEMTRTYAAHRCLGSRLGGLHLEQTGEAVTECVDHLAMDNSGSTLGINSSSLCDPRLSRKQALLLVERFTDYVQNFDQLARPEPESQAVPLLLYQAPSLTVT